MVCMMGTVPGHEDKAKSSIATAEPSRPVYLRSYRCKADPGGGLGSRANEVHRFATARRCLLMARRRTHSLSEEQWQCERPRINFSRRPARTMTWRISTILRAASFFQRGPTGAVSRIPLRKKLAARKIVEMRQV